MAQVKATTHRSVLFDQHTFNKKDPFPSRETSGSVEIFDDTIADDAIKGTS